MTFFELPDVQDVALEGLTIDDLEFCLFVFHIESDATRIIFLATRFCIEARFIKDNPK
jgi:hypothetical protein